MPQAHYEDDVTILAPVLKVQFEALKEHLDERLDRVEHQIDGLDVHVREHCRLIETQLGQHEKRLTTQERQSVWRWGATVLSAFLALLGIRSPQ